jgi:hypothetical protein
MPYPMESGMEIMAADTAPERSPLMLDSGLLKFIAVLPSSASIREKRF